MKQTNARIRELLGQKLLPMKPDPFNAARVSERAQQQRMTEPVYQPQVRRLMKMGER